MGIKKKSSGIDFKNILIKKAFEKAKTTDPILYKHLTHAFKDILENAFYGIQIPKKLIPLEYQCDNLWKYNLPDAQRLIYTIKSPNKIEIISVILEWMNHKDYARKFGYQFKFLQLVEQFMHVTRRIIGITDALERFNKSQHSSSNFSTKIC